MKTLKEIKKDMEFNRELSSLIDVLKGIASSQFRHLQAKREYFNRFNLALADIFKTVNLAKSYNPFISGFKESDIKAGIVMITSDEGFLGELNSSVINTGLGLRQDSDELIVLGERGANLLEEVNESFLYFPGIPEEIGHTYSENLRDYIVTQYLGKRFGKILIVYPEFISFSIQEVKSEQLLPYTGGNTYSQEPAVGNPLLEVLFEPSGERVIDYLIRLWLGQRLYDIFWDSKLSEFASRIVQLEGGSQVISELSSQLRLKYFHITHQISDKNIREIFSSRLIEK